MNVAIDALMNSPAIRALTKAQRRIARQKIRADLRRVGAFLGFVGGFFRSAVSKS